MEHPWIVEFADDGVEAELRAMPKDIQARFLRISALLKLHGPFRVGMPYVRHVRDKLWEARMKGRDGIARGFYVVVTGRRVVMVRFFAKKTAKAPVQEIELALQRARKVLDG